MIQVSGLLPEMVKTFKILEKGNIIPFQSPYLILKSNKGSSTPKFVASTNYKQWQWLLHIEILVLASVLGTYKYFMESTSVMEKTLALWNNLTLLVHAFWAFYYYKEAGPIAEFFNQLVNFENRHLSNGGTGDFGRCATLENEHVTGNSPGTDTLKFKDMLGCKQAVVLAKMMRTSISFVCIMLSLSGAFVPKAAWALLPKGFLDAKIPLISDSILFEIFQRLVSFLFTYATWRSLCNIGIVCCVLNLAILTYCLNAAIILFQWNLLNSTKSAGALGLMYREIQLLCKLYNELHKSCVIMAFMIYMPACVSVCIYLVLSRWRELDVMSLLMFSNYAQAATVVILFVFQNAVKIYVLSKNMKYSAKRGSSTLLMKKYCRSFQVVKVCFFSSNFFESNTPLVIMDFSVDQAISLVLVDER